MYRRMRGTFDRLTVSRVVKASPLTIQFKAPTTEGVEADVVVDFEETAPFRIAAIGVEVQIQGGPQ